MLNNKYGDTNPSLTNQKKPFNLTFQVAEGPHYHQGPPDCDFSFSWPSVIKDACLMKTVGFYATLNLCRCPPLFVKTIRNW